MHFVYILYSPAIDRFYIGECEDIEDRPQQHNNGHYKGAFTTVTNDWVLYFSAPCESRSQARRIELHIKKMKSRKYLQNLSRYPEIIQKLKEKYSSRGTQSR